MTRVGLHVVWIAPFAAYVVALPDSRGEVETLQVGSEAEAWVQGVCAAALVAYEFTVDSEIRVSLRPSQIHRWWRAPWTGDTGRMIARVHELGIRVTFRSALTPLTPAETEVMWAAASGETASACSVSLRSTPGMLSGIGVRS